MRKNFANQKKAIGVEGPQKKKHLGQHFLRDADVVEKMISAVKIESRAILEIGCGDGFLTQAILESNPCCKTLISVEFDRDWFDFVNKKLKDPRLILIHDNVLDIDFSSLQVTFPMVLLANLPYNISFPILYKLVENKHLFSEGVFMVQEEVAQRLVAVSGRDKGSISLFMQHHFDFRLLDKIHPSAFLPPPKVFSRTVYFKPKTDSLGLEQKDVVAFWDFVKHCFHHPRQTLGNNLKKANFGASVIERLDKSELSARAQQLKLEQFLEIWRKLQQ